MSIELKVNPDNMSLKQRQAVSDFIKSYPSFGNDTMSFKLKIDTKEAQDGIQMLAEQASASMQNVHAPLPEESFKAHLAGVIESELLKHGAVPNVTNPSPEEVFGNTLVATAQGVDLDKAGFPWDQRIHSGNKQKVTDGTWRKRRGIDDATVALVEGELRQVMGAPAAVKAPTPPPSDAVKPPAPPAPPPASAIPPIPPSLVRAAPSSGSDPRQLYTALVGRSAQAFAARKLTPEQVSACCTKYGIPSLPLLANRLDLVQHVAAEIDAMIAGAA